MEKKTLYLIYVIIVLPFAVACRDTEDNLTVSTLRSDIHDYLYTINNSEATQRLDSIMYNKTDTDKIYERFKIVHISDPHISAISTNNNYTNPINLKQSVTFANQSKLKINALIATGDFISNSSRKDAILFMESFTKHFCEGNHIPSFICTGNHDCNMIEKVSKNYISKEKIHSILFPKQTQTNQNYFYADIPNPQGGSIRIISLDMLDQPGTEYNTRIYAYYSQEQINWLGNIALKKGITDQHSIIILNHYPFQAYSSKANTYLCDGDFVHPWFMIPEIIEAYRSRSSISKTYLNKLRENKNISVNFLTERACPCADIVGKIRCADIDTYSYAQSVNLSVFYNRLNKNSADLFAANVNVVHPLDFRVKVCHFLNRFCNRDSYGRGNINNVIQIALRTNNN